MKSVDGFSAYHECAATALAREMNLYVEHSTKMFEQLQQRDLRGNAPVYTNPQKATTWELRLKITILAAVYVEALANFYLSFKLDDEQLATLDRMEILQKWVTLPSLFLAGYSFPKSDVMHADLKALITHRNAIAHMRPQISAGTTVLHKGNFPESIDIHKQIGGWDTLPARLVEHLGKSDSSLEFQKFRVATSLDEYDRIRESHPYPYPAAPKSRRKAKPKP